MKAFWDQVSKSDDCWLWEGKQNNQGYGVLGAQKVHRLSYELHIGAIPEGMVIKHTCDHKLCIKPQHLELGTYSENLQEAYDRGLRKPKQTQSESVRLSTEQIAYIQSSDKKPGTLAKELNISPQRVRSIKKGVIRLKAMDIDLIRQDQGTIKELAQKYHLSKHKICELRSGVHKTVTPVTPELLENLKQLSKILRFNEHPNYSEIAKRLNKTRAWVKRILQKGQDEI